MQTFLPYPSFEKSAQCLDNKRLGKQRVECLQILRALDDPTYGWQNHPAVKMWRGYDHKLWHYSLAICNEWIRRGFNDSVKLALEFYRREAQWETAPVKPIWLGSEAFHASHRSNLLRKDQFHYGKFNWSELNDLPYVWPVK